MHSKTLLTLLFSTLLLSACTGTGLKSFGEFRQQTNTPEGRFEMVMETCGRSFQNQSYCECTAEQLERHLTPGEWRVYQAYANGSTQPYSSATDAEKRGYRVKTERAHTYCLQQSAGN